MVYGGPHLDYTVRQVQADEKGIVWMPVYVMPHAHVVHIIAGSLIFQEKKKENHIHLEL